MKKSNIIFFCWENSIFLKKSLNRWIELFIEKYWENNVIKISKEQLSTANIEQELLWLPFLSEKKLVALFWIPSNWENKDESWVEEKISNILDKIPDSNFILFVEQNPDKRKQLYKKLLEIATIKEFANLDDFSLREYIKESLPWIEKVAIDKLIKYKNSNIEKIEQEIEKLSLFRNNETITSDDITNFVNEEIESSIFNFLDRLIELNYNKALQSFENILINSKIEPTFAAIMTNLRKYLFTIYFYTNWFSEWEIINKLKLHPFVYKKNISYKNNYNTIKHIYKAFASIDARAKSWKLIWDSDDNIKLAIEKVIFDLKKEKNRIK